MNIEVHQQKMDKDGNPIQIPKAKEGHVPGNLELAKLK